MKRKYLQAFTYNRTLSVPEKKRKHYEQTKIEESILSNKCLFLSDYKSAEEEEVEITSNRFVSSTSTKSHKILKLNVSTDEESDVDITGSASEDEQ